MKVFKNKNKDSQTLELLLLAIELKSTDESSPYIPSATKSNSGKAVMVCRWCWSCFGMEHHSDCLFSIYNDIRKELRDERLREAYGSRG